MANRWSREIERSRPEYRRSLLMTSLLFGVLLLVEFVLIQQLLSKDLSQRHILETISSYHEDGLLVAQRLAEVLKEEGKFDLFTVKEKVTYITQQFSSTMGQRVGFHHISVYDSLGRMIVTIYRQKTDLVTLPGAPDSPPPPTVEPPDAPRMIQSGGISGVSGVESFPLDGRIANEGEGQSGRRDRSGTPSRTYLLDTAQHESVLVVPVSTPGGESREAGLVQVGYDQQLIQDEVAQLRQDLLKKVIAWGFLTLVVLCIGFLYVLKLLQKTRRLEAEAQIADRMAYIGTLASGLAHEIRNPLNAMNMNLQLLDEELGGSAEADCVESMPAPTQEMRELMESTKGEIKRLDRLVNNFLAFARPSALSRSVCDINAAVEGVVRFLRGDFAAHGIEVLSHYAPQMPAVDLDESQFKQAILNIFINARQVLPRGGRIDVSTGTDGAGEPRVRIEDNGPGIPPDQLPKIFEVFYSTRSGGTGLGLPIAQRIIEGHGGRVEVESTLGKGAAFTIRIPRRHPATASSAHEVEAIGQ